MESGCMAEMGIPPPRVRPRGVAVRATFLAERGFGIPGQFLELYSAVWRRRRSARCTAPLTSPPESLATL